MKSIKDLRENYNLITEKEEHDMNKLSQLVRAGLFDAKKLSALKRAMDKPADKMTAQEKRMMINLLDALMAEVLSDKQVYRKIKQDVMKEAKDWESKDYFATPDPRVKRVGYPSQKEAPSVLLLKRKAIRVFPDGQKVALYYAQAIDKYVTIPYNEIGITESVASVANTVSNIISGMADASGSSNNSSSSSDSYSKPLETKLKWNDSGLTGKEGDNRPDAVRSRMERLNRLANQAMAKNVRENFKSKLEVLREAGGAPGVASKWMKAHPDQGKTLGNIATSLIPGLDAIAKTKEGDYVGAVTSLGRDVATAVIGGKIVGAAAPYIAKGVSSGYKYAKNLYKTIKAAKEAKKAEDAAAKAVSQAISKTPPSRTPQTRTDIVTGTRSPSTRQNLTLMGRGTSGVRGPQGSTGFSTPNLKIDVPKTPTTLPTKSAGSDFASQPSASGNVIPIKKPSSGGTTASGNLSAPKVDQPAAKIELKPVDNVKVKPETQPSPGKPTPQRVPYNPKRPRRDLEPNWRPVRKPPSAPEQPIKSPEKPIVPVPAPAPSAPQPAKPDVKPKRVYPDLPGPEQIPLSPAPLPAKPQIKPKRVGPFPAPDYTPPAPKPVAPKPASKPLPKPGKGPNIAPTHAPATVSAPATAAAPAPATAAAPTLANQPAAANKPAPKKDPKEEAAKRRQVRDRKGKKDKPKLRGFLLPDIPSFKGKDLNPLDPKLKPMFSAPKREGEASALASRMSSIEREALKAQASLTEDVTVDLSGNLFEINRRAADKVTSLYESLNAKNKKHMIKMMKESNDQLQKIITFATRQ